MTELVIRELTPGFGAEVEGLEPHIPLDDATSRLLRDAFDERGLLVFRDLDADQPFQKYLTHLLIGREVPPAPADPSVAKPERRIVVSNKEQGGNAPYGRLMFHCDMMWSDDPCQALSLYGVEVEQPAVPTLFVSAAVAWETLPDDLRQRVDGLHAVHGHDTTYPNRGADDDVLVGTFEAPKMATTTMPHPHPRTGRPLLHACQQATLEFVELAPDDNEAMLEALFAHMYSPDAIYAHQWRTGDLAVWDNLAVQHARPNVSTEGPARTLRKIFAPAPQPVSDTLVPRFSDA